MGASINKQYLSLAGRPILAQTLDLFSRHPAVNSIYPILPEKDISSVWTDIIERWRIAKVEQLVRGGEERQDSVLNALRVLAEQGINGGTVVLVHDGVRPLFDPTLIPSIIEQVLQYGGCVVGVPVKDTIKDVEDRRIIGTPERQRLWQAQTPQAFRFETLLRAYEEAERDGFRGTDDASLVARLGAPVMMLQGSYRNLKLTTPEDLLMAEALFEAREDLQ